MLKVSDVRLRGCGFTLFPAAEEANVPEILMDAILEAIHYKASDKDSEMVTDFQKEDFNPKTLQACIETGLLLEGDVYTLSEKAVSILQVAAQKQQELDDEGFHYCPCHHC